MASQQDPLPLAERTDVHKSCKSLETLLGVLNDYCEAANAIALLQRKLARALRDAAGVRVTGEIASNAMTTAATIFETLAEVDVKFAKIADREYDALSGEVKKWFKKLAKEERAHDERLVNANAKIKQAGQLYEKKMKKNPREAADEHARYINLISSVGPEISQDKYNHALFVTQRHTATTYSTAACLARIADAEWLRTCESVRRFSPSIGPLSEWRTYCEGQWQGGIPQDLPDLDAQKLQAMNNVAVVPSDRAPDYDTQRSVSFQYPEREAQAQNPAATTPAEQDAPPPRYPSSQGTMNERPRLVSQPTPSANVAPSQELAPPKMPAAMGNNFESVRTLSAFPLPPDHFPIPPPRQQGSFSQSSQSSQPRMTESPLPDGDSSSPEISKMIPSQVPSQDPDSNVNLERLTRPDAVQVAPDTSGLKAPEAREMVSNSTKASPVVPSAPQPQFLERPRSRSPETSFKEYNDREFGLRNGSTVKAKTIDVANTNVDRSEPAGTTSSSLVAAMRHRYTNSSGAISPTREREQPRLPNKSVNELAARYQPSEESEPPRMRSPSSPKPLPQPQLQRLSTAPVDAPKQPERRNSYEPRVELSRLNTGPESPQLGRRALPQEEQQRQAHLAELERKEYELRQRERELDYRSRLLDSERAQLQNVPEADEGAVQQYNQQQQQQQQPQAQPQRKTRERKTSFKLFGQHPPSPRDAERSSPVTTTGPGRPYHAVQHSYSASHLAPPSQPSAPQRSESFDRQSQASSSYNPRLSNASQQSVQGHAPFCGCEACSVSKYKESSSSSSAVPHTPAPPPQLRPIPEKKTSWVKRLSMPVGSALGLDSRKGAGVVNIPGNGMSLDGKKISSTGLYDRAQIDGRRSYDPNAVGNRSMTNLGAGAIRR